MIIQCEKCQTRFRLDDSRVKDKGVKVRCTKCKHVFRVQKEVPEEESLSQQFAARAVLDAPFDSETPGVSSASNIADDFSSLETSNFDDSTTLIEPDDFLVAVGEDITGSAVKSSDVVGDVDFSSFDFGECNTEPDSTIRSTLSLDDFTDAKAESAKALPLKEAPQGLDFSDDDMFGEAVQNTPEASGEAITFDFEGDNSFAESMDMSGKDTSRKSGTLFSLSTPVDTSFNLGEIDFGDELTSVAVQQVNPEDLKPSQEVLFAPIAEAKDKIVGDETFKQSFPEVGSDHGQNELPPLSISSRRKPNPFFGAVVGAMSLMVIAIVGYLGYLAYSSSSTSKEIGVQESGKITVKGVKSVFIDNDQAGELLVISGEALNEYSAQRAALQVKVTVFDSAGQSIASKSAYGGNPLTEDQLESLPMDKIESAMANQFGDSLANMEVGSGKSIPFVVVLANLPKGAKDFAVESAGSTVATGKQE